MIHLFNRGGLVLSPSSQKSKSRRHHVVPQFYLKRFANDKDQLLQVWLVGDKRKHLSKVKDATVVQDYNSYRTFDGELNDDLEQVLSRIEDQSARAFVAALEKQIWPLPDEERYAMASWVATQYLRSEKHRQTTNEVFAETVKLLTGIRGIERLKWVMEKTLRRPVGHDELEAEWEDLTKPGGPTIKLSNLAHLENTARLIGQVADNIFGASWVLMTFEEPCLFTSDFPVSLFPDQENTDRGIGIATASMIVAPLSRTTALLINPQHNSPDATVQGNIDYSHFINQGSVLWANRYILVNPSDESWIPETLPEPHYRTLGLIDDSMVSREGMMAMFSEDTEAEFINNLKEEDKENPLANFEWPIPGRVFKNPYSPQN